LANASVMDLLLKVIASEDPTSDTPIGTLSWLCTTDLMESLVAKLNPTNSDEVIENSAQALIDIINVSENQKDSPLISQLESEKIINQIFEYMFQGTLSFSLLHGLAVLIELITRHTCQDFDDRPLEKLPPLLQQISQHVDKFTPLLIREKNGNQYSSTLGPIPQLGFHRLKAVEFFTASVLTRYGYIQELLMKKKRFQFMF